jgi:hypothetical protein
VADNCPIFRRGNIVTVVTAQKALIDEKFRKFTVDVSQGCVLENVEGISKLSDTEKLI